MSTTVPGAARVPAAGFCATTVPGLAPAVRRRVTVPDRRTFYYSNDPRSASEAHYGYYIRDASGSLFVNSLTDSIRPHGCPVQGAALNARISAACSS